VTRLRTAVLVVPVLLFWLLLALAPDAIAWTTKALAGIVVPTIWLSVMAIRHERD
jgi:hypothetical protein